MNLHFKKRKNTSYPTYMQIDHLPLTRDLIIVGCLWSGNKPTLGQRLVFCRAVVLNPDCVELSRLTVTKIMKQTISWLDWFLTVHRLVITGAPIFPTGPGVQGVWQVDTCVNIGYRMQATAFPFFPNYTF